MQIQNRYQKEIDRLEKENKDLRKQLILKEQRTGNRKRRMKVGNSFTLNAPNTTIAKFANTVDPEERAHNEPSHLDLQCLPSSL